MTTPHRNAHQFSPRLLETIERPPSPLPRVMTYALLLLLILVVAWTFFGRLDIVARAQGKLVPKTRIKVVQPFEGGRVAKILVEEDQLVKAGQVLVLMDKQLSQADTRKLRADLDYNQLQLRRVNAELAGAEFAGQPGDDPTAFHDVLDQYASHRKVYLHAVAQQRALLRQARQEQAAAREQYAKLKETLPLRHASEQAFHKLEKQGYAARLAAMDRQRQRIEVERDMRAQRYTIRANAARIREAKEKLAEIQATYRQKLLDGQVDLQRKIAQLRQDWSKQQYRNRLLELRAPQAGYVKDLVTRTKGTVLPAGSVVLNIVPVDVPLQAQVLVNHQDIGFVTQGQIAKIKLASYEFQKYGMIDGVVGRVGADATSAADKPNGRLNSQQAPGPGYRTVIDLQRQYLERDGKRFLLRPGMQVTAEIHLGARSVMDYILSPIERTVEEAGTEH